MKSVMSNASQKKTYLLQSISDISLFQFEFLMLEKWDTVQIQSSPKRSHRIPYVRL